MTNAGDHRMALKPEDATSKLSAGSDGANRVMCHHGQPVTCC